MNQSQSSDHNRSSSSINSPSESNPLGASWVETFREINGKMPTDMDRQDRLFSLLFIGLGIDGNWTVEDWKQYKHEKKLLWTGQKSWKDDYSNSDFDRFILNLEQLARQYDNNPENAGEFARAVGLIWSGIAYDAWVASALLRAAVGDHLLQLNEGTTGWIANYVDDANPAHHWAAAFLTGYCFGTFVGIVASSARDIAQYLTGLGGTREDISLGILGAKHGGSFRRNTRSSSGNKGPYTLLFSQMRKDLQEK